MQNVLWNVSVWDLCVVIAHLNMIVKGEQIEIFPKAIDLFVLYLCKCILFIIILFFCRTLLNI